MTTVDADILREMIAQYSARREKLQAEYYAVDGAVQVLTELLAKLEAPKDGAPQGA